MQQPIASASACCALAIWLALFTASIQPERKDAAKDAIYSIP